MPEWSTYSLSDLVLFTARTYYRQFELYNQDMWPLHILAIASGVAILVVLRFKPHWHGRAIAAILTVSWLWVAWAYHHERFALINWVASWYAIAFAIEALILFWVGVIRNQFLITRTRALNVAGLLIFVFALFVLAFISLLIGREWKQVELFAIAPDPTVLATLGLMLLLSNSTWLVFVIPVTWCLISGATLWVLESPVALILPLIAFVTLVFLTLKRQTK